jgi:hypothetical protein
VVLGCEGAADGCHHPLNAAGSSRPRYVQGVGGRGGGAIGLSDDDVRGGQTGQRDAAVTVTHSRQISQRGLIGRDRSPGLAEELPTLGALDLEIAGGAERTVALTSISIVVRGGPVVRGVNELLEAVSKPSKAKPWASCWNIAARIGVDSRPSSRRAARISPMA